MIQIPKRFIQAFFLLLVSIIFVGDLALVDWAKKEAVDRPTEIVLIRETAPDGQIDGVSEMVKEPVEEKEPFFRAERLKVNVRKTILKVLYPAILFFLRLLTLKISAHSLTSAVWTV